MGKFATVENDFVTNVMVLDASQKDEMAAALGKELVDAEPFRLAIGDYRKDGTTWTRNIDGVQTELTEQATYTELQEALNLLIDGV